MIELATLSDWRAARAEAALREADALADALVHCDNVEPILAARFGSDHARVREARSYKATLRDAIHECQDEAEGQRS